MSFSFLLRVHRAGNLEPKKESNQMSERSFRELGVSAQVAASLAARSIDVPFRVQELVLPDALAGLDVLVRSPTGSGKTLAYALPIVEGTENTGPRPSALVLVPTRELAAQVTAEFQLLVTVKGLRVAAAYGGLPLRSQAARIKGAHILVATPGRLPAPPPPRPGGLSPTPPFLPRP